MKNLVAVWAICSAGLVSVEAYAVPITFTDTTTFTATDAVDLDNPTESSNLDSFSRGDVNFLQTNLMQALASDFDYVSWTHQFSFDPMVDYVLNGSLALTFRDDTDNGWFKKEYAFGFTEEGNWGFGEVDSATYDFGVTGSFLEDGLFSVTVASFIGDFFLDRSDLTVTYEPVASDSVSVPEPSTLAIMGGGLLVFGLMNGLRRRRPDLSSKLAY